VELGPLSRNIVKMIKQMGGKRNKPGTPPHNRKLTGVWKKQNSSVSPVKLLTAPPEKTAYKPWPERAQEASQSKDSSCWSEEVTKATPKSQLGKKLDKITLEVNYEISKKSRGGDGSTFAFVEGTPTWIKPLDFNAKASPAQKKASGNANLTNLPTTGKLQLESQESSSSPSSRSSSSKSFSNNSSSTEKRDNTVTTLSLTDPEQFPPLVASSRKDVTPGNKLSDKVLQSTLVINVSQQPEIQGEKKGDRAECDETLDLQVATL
jgi:hypothetical protein